MKRFVALVMVLCVLCLSLTGCEAKAKEPSEEEYLAWAEKTWGAINEVYETYGFDVQRSFLSLAYLDENEVYIYPKTDFLLLDDMRKLNENQTQELQKIGYFSSQELQNNIYLLYSFVHQTGNEIKTIKDERDRFSTVPESYNYIDTQLCASISLLYKWHQEICTELQDNNTSDKLAQIPNLLGYGANEDEFMKYIKNGVEREEAFGKAGSIIGYITTLKALLG